jgi:hypothetical protein
VTPPRLLTKEVSMPWRETAPMTERMRFVTDWERDLYSMVELCERYGGQPEDRLQVARTL